MRTSFEPVGGFTAHGPKLFPSRKYDPQVTAWVVLSLAFVVFWLLVIGAFAYGKQHYDTATVPGGATLSIESGIVLFRDSVTSMLVNATDNLALREGDEVMVGQGGSASITLFDGSTLHLYSSSDVVLKELRKSQFHDGFTRTALSIGKGLARLQVAQPQTEEARFMAFVPNGSAVLGPGNYGIEVADGHTRISAREGFASVAGKGATAELNAGTKAVLTQDGLDGPLPEGDALVRNGNFSQGFNQWNPLDLSEPGRPEELGQRLLTAERIGGRDTMALRVSRLSPRGTHGETGLTQVINKDVSDYLSLKLRANVKVTGQSLSGGGYMGYEYPLMIRVRYRDATGGQIDWTHGFFATNPEGRPTPNGEEVPRGEWISYNGDLMEVSPRPVHVISVEVLGAGHTYDGSIADVELVGK